MNTTSVTQAQQIDSHIGKLSFENGFPSKDTVTKLYDEMDFQRATQAYLWGVPAVSNQSMQIGFFRDLGADFNDIILFENFLDTKGLFLTGNTTTLYAIVLVDLVRMARSSLRSRRGRLQAWWMTFGSAP